MTRNNISKQKYCLVHLLIGFSLFLGTRASCPEISGPCLVSTYGAYPALPFQLDSDVPYIACDSAVNEVDPSANKTCILDYGIGTSFPSNCTAIGGMLYTINFSYPCQFLLLDGTNPYNVTYFYRNYPYCLGADCTDADAEAYVFHDYAGFLKPPPEPGLGKIFCPHRVFESSTERAAVFTVAGGVVGMWMIMMMCARSS